MQKYLNKYWILKLRVMLRGLAWDNTKSVLVQTRPWALLTLGRVFSCSSWSFSLQDTHPPMMSFGLVLSLRASRLRIAHLAYLNDKQWCKIRKHYMMYLKGIQGKHKVAIAWVLMRGFRFQLLLAWSVSHKGRLLNTLRKIKQTTC